MLPFWPSENGHLGRRAEACTTIFRQFRSPDRRSHGSRLAHTSGAAGRVHLIAESLHSRPVPRNLTPAEGCSVRQNLKRRRGFKYRTCRHRPIRRRPTHSPLPSWHPGFRFAGRLGLPPREVRCLPGSYLPLPGCRPRISQSRRLLLPPTPRKCHSTGRRRTDCGCCPQAVCRPRRRQPSKARC